MVRGVLAGSVLALVCGRWLGIGVDVSGCRGVCSRGFRAGL